MQLSCGSSALRFFRIRDLVLPRWELAPSFSSGALTAIGLDPPSCEAQELIPREDASASEAYFSDDGPRRSLFSGVRHDVCDTPIVRPRLILVQFMKISVIFP